MTELCNLPEDTALNILSRLPPKSLVRFKCVHKSCARSSRTPKPTTGTLLTLVSNSYGNAGEDAADENEQNKIHSFVAEDIAREQCFGFEDLKSVTLHGHADGIICLSSRFRQQHGFMQPGNQGIKKCASPDPGVGALGFGSNPKTRDFKVVNITENDSQLVVWDESVALYASIHDGSMGLWLMDDGCGWTKLFAFTALEDVPTLSRYWRGSSHDELLLMVSQEGRLFTFDLNIETQEYVPVCSMDDYQDSVFREYAAVWGGDPDCLQVVVCVGVP
ncbi:hypothetical protein L3X38_035429 [Prunus dulcis]|uniref:F-box domain-containing protein n=1 Tax=Prunus dulcis TaxID=3755 RepID=A0AAD4VJN4_PRUDU|nr:hypothetical protein L3X38_035429 [Prunus dulcis]